MLLTGFDGRLFWGYEALEHGLADEIGDHRGAVRKAVELANLEEGRHIVIELD
jgi:ClpP class serine protease